MNISDTISNGPGNDKTMSTKHRVNASETLDTPLSTGLMSHMNDQKLEYSLDKTSEE